MAKRFQFRLETLLSVRRLREREAQRKVATKSAEIARLDQQNRRAASEISRRQSELLRTQDRGRLDAGELTRIRAWVANLRSAILQRQRLRAGLVSELEGLQAELGEARKQTRIIEKLRERRWEAYLTLRNRREQAAADELAQQLHAFAESEAKPLGVSAAEARPARRAPVAIVE